MHVVRYVLCINHFQLPSCFACQIWKSTVCYTLISIRIQTVCLKMSDDHDIEFHYVNNTTKNNLMFIKVCQIIVSTLLDADKTGPLDFVCSI